jgi:hypothetical protein
MFGIIWAIVRTLVTAVRSRRDLLLENLALRQQLAAFKARGKTPRIRAADRAFWLVLRQIWVRWADVLVIVKPDTVVRWHRAGFKLYWSWISRRGSQQGRSPVEAEVRALIRRMASENGWGAPRIHGELLMLAAAKSYSTTCSWPTKRTYADCCASTSRTITRIGRTAASARARRRVESSSRGP